MNVFETIIERAASDPDFLDRLRVDPLGAVRAAGYDLTADELRAGLGLSAASHEEMVEVLQARISLL